MIIKKGTDYLITEKGTNSRTLKIYCSVKEDGITLFNEYKQIDFNFIDSQPEMLIKIGKMIQQAGKLKP